MPTLIRTISIVFASLGLVACGGSSDETQCGAGTTLVDGACVASSTPVQCGAGTTVADGVCVPESREDVTADDAGSDEDGVPGEDVEPTPEDVTEEDALEEDISDEDVEPSEDVEPPAPCDPECQPWEECLVDTCVPRPVPPEWLCAPEWWVDGDACDCACGVPDPDCLSGELEVVGCDGGACNEDGTCAVCAPDCTDKACGDDGCGGVCGYCSSLLPICSNGECIACVPVCDGKECGDDGCGGSCGSCDLGLQCSEGGCALPPAGESCDGYCGGVAPSGCSCEAECDAEGTCCADAMLCQCQPSCGGGACGDDGCGGTCPACPTGQTCDAGFCAAIPCTDSTCSGAGACIPETGACDCNAGVTGPSCGECAEGHVGWPVCGTACTNDDECSDGNLCTVDVCDPDYGCFAVNEDGRGCLDDDPCTLTESCADGVCVPGPQCDDGSVCTSDACTGESCTHAPLAAANGLACDDGDACTESTLCEVGECGGGQDLDCDDQNACTNDLCDADSGCSHEPITTECALDACSFYAVCQNGACTSVIDVDCDDGDDCTIDACSPESGGCTNVPAEVGATCDDGDLCTRGDACDDQGECLGATVECSLTVMGGLAAWWSAADASAIESDGAGVYWWADALNGYGLEPSDTTDAPSFDAHAGPGGHAGVELIGSKGLRGVVSGLLVDGAVSALGAACLRPGASGVILRHGDALTVTATTAGALELTAPSALVSVSLGGEQCFVFAARVGSHGAVLDVATRFTRGASSSTPSAPSAPLGTPIVLSPDGADVVVSELLYYNTVITDTERDEVLTYLRTAWDLPEPSADQGWFDASDVASLDVDADGGVLAWEDKGGANLAAISPAGAALALWDDLGAPGGQAAVYFSGAARLATAVSTSAPEVTLIAVMAMGEPATGGTILSHGAGYAVRRATCAGCDGRIEWVVAGMSGAAPTAPFTPWGWTVLTAVRSATSAELLVLDSPPSLVARTSVGSGPAALVIGNASDGQHSMEGALGELRIYGSVLHPADRAFVVDRLRAKYGL